MTLHLKDEQKEFRDAYKKRIEEKRKRRSLKFQESVEKKRPFPNGSRLKGSALPSP